MLKIETIFDQYRFANEHQKCLTGLVYLSSMTRRLMEQTLRTFGVTPKQYRILKALADAYPEAVSMKYLREYAIDRESDISRIVVRMQEAGWINREVNSEDSRVADIMITESGKELLEKLNKSQQLLWLKVGGKEEILKQLNIHFEQILVEVYHQGKKK